VTVDLSVVIASFNRPQLVQRLLRQLATQTLAGDRFEVIVVDDGSEVPVESVLGDTGLKRLRVVRQANAGAAAARDAGIRQAKGALLVITDDDMQVPPHFLEAHMAAHAVGRRRVVLGRIRADPNVGQMPYFERWYAHRLDSIAREASQGRLQLTGMAVYTGNVSMQRADYLAVGGFDPELKRSEDAELGLKLEASGVEVAFSNDAFTWHGSDHTSEAVWLKRAHLYGIYDSRIRDKHDGEPSADPWRLLFRLSVPARPLVALSALAPTLSRPVSAVGLQAVKVADALGLTPLVNAGSAVVYSMEYFRGVRAASGSLGGALKGLRAYLNRR
jgi:glycosyltransferase involved in cell wall biosynthesis